jgi:HNH endonuclease
MKPKKLDTTRLWKQLEDFLYPRLGFSITDRAVYSHLLRHTRLEGKLQVHCSMPWLARGVGLSTGPVRESVRRLTVLGPLRLVHRSKSGHIIEVRLPDEIRAVRPGAISVGGPVNLTRPGNPAACLEELDFLKTRALRQSIHLRERGHCFYCLRRTDARIQCLDHVVPKAKAGRNCYRNLVSCCLECNSLKGERRASDFLRWLYREGRLTATELTGRLRALEALAAGKLRPPVQHADNPVGTSTHTLGRGGARRIPNPSFRAERAD